MASEYLSNHLLSNRKRSALSQGEVAYLLGFQRSATVCDHERFNVVTSLQTGLAYEVIYGRPISDLFPGLVEKIQADVRTRAKILEQKVLHSNSRGLTIRKRRSLAAIVAAEFNGQLR
jgi:hypothetical protein